MHVLHQNSILKKNNLKTKVKTAILDPYIIIQFLMLTMHVLILSWL